jgi:hopene-associated glycosyltransferase HpnB
MPVTVDIWLILAAIVLGAWVSLALFRGRFYRCREQLQVEGSEDDDQSWPVVTAVIPARNEAQTIGATVRSLLNQSYAGTFLVVLVDDQSTDATAENARKAANESASSDSRLHIVSGAELPPGWSGKLWALHQGVQQARIVAPQTELILFTDADIIHAPNTLQRLTVKMQTEHLAMASLMVQLRCLSLWEKMLIPPFIFFFQKLYPFPWVNDPRRRTAAAAGGCVLLRRTALEGLGGVESIRGAIIDDCTLAKRAKTQGPIWLGLSRECRSLRAYEHLSEIWRMVARTAFVQLEYSFWRLLGTLVGMGLLYLLPVVLIPFAIVDKRPLLGVLGGLSWMVMARLYEPTVRLYGLSRLRCWLLPLPALLYTLMTLDAARRHWFGAGAEWKGRNYRLHPRSGSSSVSGP